MSKFVCILAILAPFLYCNSSSEVLYNVTVFSSSSSMLYRAGMCFNLCDAVSLISNVPCVIIGIEVFFRSIPILHDTATAVCGGIEISVLVNSVRSMVCCSLCRGILISVLNFVACCFLTSCRYMCSFVSMTL